MIQQNMQSEGSKPQLHQHPDQREHHKGREKHPEGSQIQYRPRNQVSVQEKQQLKRQLYQLQLEGAAQQNGMWQHALVQIDELLNRTMEGRYQTLNKKTGCTQTNPELHEHRLNNHKRNHVHNPGS